MIWQIMTNYIVYNVYPVNQTLRICYSRNESWRCLFLKMNKITAWKNTHVPRSAFIYGHGPCKSTISFNSNPDYVIKERMVLWQQGLLVILCIHRVGIEEAGGFFLFQTNFFSIQILNLLAKYLASWSHFTYLYYFFSITFGF